MDTVFKPALRTYSRAGRNQCRRQQDKNDAVFTEQAFKQGEKSTLEELQMIANLEDQKENVPEKPSTGKKQARKEPATTKKTRSKRVPQTKHGRLKTGRQIKRKASVIGQTRNLNLMKKSGSIPKAAVRSYEKVTEWLEKSAKYCKRPSTTSSRKKGMGGDDSNDYPSREIMRTDLSSDYPSREIMRTDFSSDYPSREIMRTDLSSEYPSREIMRGDHSSEYPSKEIMRGEEISGEQRRKRLFLASEFENMYGSSNRKPQKRNPEDDRLTELKRQEFFAQLKMKPGLQTRRRDDTPVVFDLLHSHSQLLPSITVESSQYTTDIPTGTETEDLTSRYTELTAEGASTGISKQFLEPTPVQTSSSLDIRKRKNRYMSSTAKFDVSGLSKFPTDISSICSSALKQKAEKTPQKSPDFKVPRSPSKQHVKVHRKGNLEPKNSTKLFTTGFVEVVDVFPHMSSIRPYSAEPTQSLLTPCTETEKIGDDLEMEWDKKKEPAQIKTSTPNKISGKDGLNFFEFDISSVGAESDDDLLQVNKSSREVNSEEIINLSDIMVGQEENLRSPIHVESVIPDDVTKSTEHSKTLQANMTGTIASEKTTNTRPSAKAATSLDSPSFQDVFVQAVVKEKGPTKYYGRKNSAASLFRNKAKGKRRTISIPGLSADGHMRDSGQRTNRSWHKGDATYESCPLTQCFSCPLNNMWMLKCIEKNSLKYQDFIKTIPADDLCC